MFDCLTHGGFDRAFESGLYQRLVITVLFSVKAARRVYSRTEYCVRFSYWMRCSIFNGKSQGDVRVGERLVVHKQGCREMSGTASARRARAFEEGP